MNNQRKNTVYKRGLGYVSKTYHKDAVLGTIKLFTLTLAGITIATGYREINKPLEMINPLVAIHKVEQVQAQEPPKRQFTNEIDAYIFEVFEEDYGDAKKILSCENKGLNPVAINHNRNGSIDEGVFQINSIHNQPNMKDYKANIKFAHKLFHKGGWRQWSCSTVLGVKSFWQ